jgi:glucose-6-phosphate 1-epimerase
LQVFDLGQTCVNGLRGLRYRDAAAGGIEKHEEAERIHFIEEVNRVYFHAPPRADLVDAHHRVLIQKAGFTDTVVWNPAAAKCATMPDLEADAYQHFVCVEAAMVETPVHLEPDAFWEGSQELIVEHG